LQNPLAGHRPLCHHPAQTSTTTMAARNPLNRTLADGIRRVGFRKWYERELLSSHAHMALALISAVAMMASFEAYRDASTGEKLLNTAFVLVSAAIALWSMRRYLYLLMHAEEMANQANCPQCEAYGLLTLQDPQDRRESVQRLVPVCCKRCGFRWNLEDG
jgi:DNA-directed RNA polymerase subunit M/transcription elongation factor TFIIS